MWCPPSFFDWRACMPCYRPMAASYMPGRLASGKRPVKFLGSALSFQGKPPLVLPCGQCIGCRLERSRRWAVRLMHEASLYDSQESCFLTLTFDDSSIPSNGSVSVRDLQLFMKRLRKELAYEGKKVRFFACGEYGDKSQRPHYHLALFGFDFFSGGTREESSRSGGLQFSHGLFTSCWPGGLHRFSELNFESAAYIARYILKKVTGKSAQGHYGKVSPEFVIMSRRPGIGRGWLDKFGLSNVYSYDEVVMSRGDSKVDMLPPPFYDKVLERADPVLFERVKTARKVLLSDAEHLKAMSDGYRIGQVKKIVAKECLKREGVL